MKKLQLVLFATLTLSIPAQHITPTAIEMSADISMSAFESKLHQYIETNMNNFKKIKSLVVVKAKINEVRAHIKALFAAYATAADVAHYTPVLAAMDKIDITKIKVSTDSAIFILNNLHPATYALIVGSLDPLTKKFLKIA